MSLGNVRKMLRTQLPPSEFTENQPWAMAEERLSRGDDGD